MTVKDVRGKERLSLIPYQALKAISKVREFGISKYGDDQCWKQGDPKDFIEASLRHTYKYLHVGKLDDESGLNHIAHAACSLVLALALLEDELNKE
jgi:hypothetical protein